MNYSKNIKKKSIGKRILISWGIVALIFVLIGFAVGSAINKPKVEAPTIETPETTETPEILIYGQYEGRIFQGDLPQSWTGKNLNFVPLDVPMDARLQEYVFYLSEAYDIDFTFVMALIQHETNFEAGAISPTDDYGLMQINSINHTYLAEELGITDFLDPYENVKAGMFILRKLFEKYETPEKVLMAYNMGETGAARLWEQGIFEVNYSKEVLQKQAEYAAEIERSKNND